MDAASTTGVPYATVLSPVSHWTPCPSTVVGIVISIIKTFASSEWRGSENTPLSTTCICCSASPVKGVHSRVLKLSIDEDEDEFSDAETLSPSTSCSSLSGLSGDDEELTQQEQSPIDIRDCDSIHFETKEKEGIRVSYSSVDAELVHHGTNFSVRWKSSESNNLLTIQGKPFHAIQFHFHTPSEHTFDGQHEAMELHVVHQAADGDLAVVAVFFRLGSESDFLAQFWEELPRLDPHAQANAVPVGEISMQKLHLLSGSFLRYRGSLTTPPYTEGVEWIVVQEVVEASREQLELFYDSLPGPNARPVQPLNKRCVRLVQ